ncbi:MAG: hypothetical protein ACI7YS_12160 [Flavobacterium sp.]
MKNIIFISIIFFSINNYSQNFESIKKLDTIYVLYTGKGYQKKIIFPAGKNNFEDRWYDYYVKDAMNQMKSITFYLCKYKDYQHKDAGLTSEIRRVKKSFIKKNKAKIIGLDFFEKNDVCKVGFEILTQTKVLYIIDYTEKKNGKITLYEVTASDVCFRGE